MVFAFSVCFDSLPLLFRTTEGFTFPSPSSAQGVWLHSASVLGFPTGPCKGSRVVFRKPWAAPWRERGCSCAPAPFCSRL